MIKKIMTNTAAMFIMRLINPFVTFLLIMYMSKVLGAEQLGKYSVLLAFLQIVQYIPLLGLQTYIIREISKEHSLYKKYLSNGSVLGAVASILIGAGVYGAGILLNYPHDMQLAMLVLAATVAPNAIAAVFESVLIGFEKMKIIAYVNVIENIVKVAVSLLVIKLGMGIIGLIAVIGLLRILAVCAYYQLTKYHCGSFKLVAFEKPVLKELFRAAPIFFGIMIFSSLINRVDFVVLSKLRTFEEVGFYTIAYRIFEISTMLSSAFILAVFPAMARARKESLVELKILAQKFIKYMFALVLLVVLSIFVLSEFIINLLFSGVYNDSVFALRIMIIGAAFICLDQILTGVLLSCNLQKHDLKVMIVGLTVYLILLFVLIPFFGIYGASVATAAALLIQLLVRYWFVTKYVFKVPVLKLIWKPLLSVLLISAMAMVFNHMNGFIVGSSAIFLYIILLFFVINKSDFIMIMNRLSKLKGKK